MDQDFINIVAGVFVTLFGWFLNRISKTMDRLDKDIRDLPHTYLSKDDYRRDIDEIKAMLEKIFNRLDTKADKR